MQMTSDQEIAKKKKKSPQVDNGLANHKGQMEEGEEKEHFD